MIKIDNTEVLGWEHAIRGMRNPYSIEGAENNSWNKSDSNYGCEEGKCDNCEVTGDFFDLPGCDYRNYVVGPNDHDLMIRLAKGGPVHAKYRRMIVVYMDITAPLYWWKEFSTYKVGTVANSCSTMHKIHAKEFTLEDFSREHLIGISDGEFKDEVFFEDSYHIRSRMIAINGLELIIKMLNHYRGLYLETKDKKYWWQMIQLLPSSYNQRRTVMLNYEVLANIYKSRKDHRLDEWREFCKWIEGLPYSEIVTGKECEV